MDSDKMLYAIDRIENNIAICQQLETKEIIELALDILPSTIKEGAIIRSYDGRYIQEENIEKFRREQLRKKLDRLKNLDKGLDKDEQK